MGQIASRGQLRMSLLRWVLVVVPAIFFLGFLSGQASGSTEENIWYVSLAKPALQPPGWLFPIAWSLLYTLIGVALAMILDARGAPGRGRAIAVFIAQFILNLVWSPLFFGAHQVLPALGVLAAMLSLAIITTFAFRAIRPRAALLMVPYLLWLSFATYLNLHIHILNPDAATRVVSPVQAEFAI